MSRWRASRPATSWRARQRERIRETRAVLAALRGRPVSVFLPFVRQSVIVGTVLSWTQRSIQLRERARLKQALLYSRLRRVALAMGDRLVGARTDRRPRRHLLPDRRRGRAAGVRRRDVPAPRQAADCPAAGRARGLWVRRRRPIRCELGVGEYLPALTQDELVRDEPGAVTSGGGAEHLRGVGACGGSATARRRFCST